MERVVVLDASYEMLGLVSVKKALGYLLKDKGTMLLASDRSIRGIGIEMMVPSIVLIPSDYYNHNPHHYKNRMGWKRHKVLQRDKNICAYCRGYGDTIDHIIPRAKNGQNSWMNTITACAVCNGEKGAMDLEDYGELEFKPTLPLSTQQIEFLEQNSVEVTG